MEEIFACIAYEPCLLDYSEFKRVQDPVWVLGREYKICDDDEEFEKLNEDIKSRIWFTYRKQFQPIGETSLTSDSGWGCMHRCGQMILAQAFLLHHFGRDWKWNKLISNEEYFKIISKFDDRPECPYSIHKIAMMGHVMDKGIGQWFGPNTIVQVLKKLVEDDLDNEMILYVAMDNMVIKSEIRKLFRKKGATSCGTESQNLENSSSSISQCNSIEPSQSSQTVSNEKENPVIVTIPLRLGLADIMPVYFEKLKEVFKLKQFIGMIGGRTNHASYFIGYIGNELINLDPHTTQLHRPDEIDDQTYHCDNPSRMKFSDLDPSIALCFYFESEVDFQQWCEVVKKDILEPEKDAIFEVLEENITMLPYVDIDDSDDINTPLNSGDRFYTSDDEFELLM
ncbi:cysteine protease ATG4A [Trichonephila inaurata madagascariensis]|uniref:Cysteine protease n=1 Tax=Trichonephila inaurata madagascariensis TaxID=2747483 RepID=A0A8X6XSD7_9ARAC|nr:cysteine protease ATG4A [Trichonephila inaurata madagascariensis]